MVAITGGAKSTTRRSSTCTSGDHSDAAYPVALNTTAVRTTTARGTFALSYVSMSLVSGFRRNSIAPAGGRCLTGPARIAMARPRTSHNAADTAQAAITV